MQSHAKSLTIALDHFLEARAFTRRRAALKPLEAQLQKALAHAFDKQGAAFLSRLAKRRGKYPPEITEVLDVIAWEDLFEQAAKETLSAFEKPLHFSILKALAHGATNTIADLGVKMKFDLKSPSAVKYMEEHGAKLVRNINETTRDYLRSVLTQGAEEGWSYQRTAKAITDRYQEFSVGVPQKAIRSRAELIATTENAFAYSEGTLSVGRDLAKEGLSVQKQWLAEPSACDICAENAGEDWIPLEDEFSSGDDMPPAHPACLCCGQVEAVTD